MKVNIQPIILNICPDCHNTGRIGNSALSFPCIKCECNDAAKGFRTYVCVCNDAAEGFRTYYIKDEDLEN